MLCQKCHKKRATIRYAEVVDGLVTEQFWCRDCMALQRNASEGFELAEVPTARPSKASIHKAVSRVVRAQRTCPECETRLQTVLESRQMGCPACYEAFADEVPGLAAKIHEAHFLLEAPLHVGKAAHQTDARNQLRTDLKAKRTLLRSVLKSENYEAAAQLRDEIRKLEAGLSNAVSGIE